MSAICASPCRHECIAKNLIGHISRTGQLPQVVKQCNGSDSEWANYEWALPKLRFESFTLPHTPVSTSQHINVQPMPLDILHEVISKIPLYSCDLAAMALVQRAWREPAQVALFRSVRLDSMRRLGHFLKSLVSHIGPVISIAAGKSKLHLEVQHLILKPFFHFNMDRNCDFMKVVLTIIPLLCNLKSIGLHLTEFSLPAINTLGWISSVAPHTLRYLTVAITYAEDQVFSNNYGYRIGWSKVFRSFTQVENIAVICQGPLFDADEAETTVPDIIGDGNPTLVGVECWSSPYMIQLGPTLQVTDMTYHSKTRVRYVFSRDTSKKWRVNPEETPMMSADQSLRVSKCSCCRIED